jgi:hypothetical protein
MRHVFHEILSRYLSNEQFAFEASPRELWPEPRPTWHPDPERGRLHRVHRELEPEN